LQAHTDQLEILADKEVTVISVNDSIEVLASQKITLQAGQTSITLDGANITFACPGKFSVKGSAHDFLSGSSDAAGLMPLPDKLVKVQPEQTKLAQRFDEQVAYADKDKLAIAGRLRFEVSNKNDKTQKQQGDQPKEGLTERLETEGAKPLEYALRYSKFEFHKQ
jgi:type VI secretion system secreted protein VgrG